MQRLPLASTHSMVPADKTRSAAACVLPEALAILRDRLGLNFEGYRTASLERRIANRMIAVRVSGADSYLELLRNTDDEAERLAANLTIKVSRFYRNSAAFDYLRESVLPQLSERFAGEPLRVWSCGCAKGEEAYTLAALLPPDSSVLATDVDEGALASARGGRYERHAFHEVPEPLVLEIAQPTSDPRFLHVSDLLRARVNFVRHDVTGEIDPVGMRFHLVCCRNVLIYFSRSVQISTLNFLVRSLVPGGVLSLGEAEWPLPEVAGLEVLDRKNRFFRRITEDARR